MAATAIARLRIFQRDDCAGQKQGEVDRNMDAVTAALALQETIAINIIPFLKMRHGSLFLSVEMRAREVAQVFLGGIMSAPKIK